MEIPPRNRNYLVFLMATLSAAISIYGAPANPSGTDDAQANAYTWSAELVSFESRTNTAVVEARIESHASIDTLESFSEGERLILVWSGLNRAAGIRELDANPDLTPKTLSLPVEFVSADRDGRYVRFRIPVPERDAARIAELDRGTWVTGTSRRMAREWSTAMNSLRPYNDVD